MGQIFRPLVIIPTFNEAKSIRETIEGILAIPTKEGNSPIEILVVDDSSPDGTKEIVEDIGSNRIHILSRPGKEGLGKAYLAGFTWGLEEKYTHFITMDGDGSHRFQDLPNLLRVSFNRDLALGSRWIPGGSIVNWPFYRVLLSRLGTLYTKILLGLPFNDITGGYRVYSRWLLESIDLSSVNSQGYCFQIEMVNRAYHIGASYIEVPITFVERVYGESKMNKKIVTEAITNVTKWGIERLFQRVFH